MSDNVYVLQTNLNMTTISLPYTHMLTHTHRHICTQISSISLLRQPLIPVLLTILSLKHRKSPSVDHYNSQWKAFKLSSPNLPCEHLILTMYVTYPCKRSIWGEHYVSPSVSYIGEQLFALQRIFFFQKYLCLQSKRLQVCSSGIV